jgi:hypothetical protein
MRTVCSLSRVLVAALCLSVAGCGASAPEDTGAATPAATPPAASDTGGDLSYPALYRDLSLPELEGARLTSTGRQTTSLRDGLALILTSPKTVDEVRDFYRDALTALGWKADPQGRGALVPNLPIGGGSFTKDGLVFTTIITALPSGESRINITVREQ